MVRDVQYVHHEHCLYCHVCLSHSIPQCIFTYFLLLEFSSFYSFTCLSSFILPFFHSFFLFFSPSILECFFPFIIFFLPSLSSVFPSICIPVFRCHFFTLPLLLCNFFNFFLSYFYSAVLINDLKACN